MIQVQTQLNIVDNTGAKTARVIKVLGGTRRRYVRIGDEVVVTVKTAEPRKSVKRKDILRAVIVRQKNAYRRKDGSYIRFDDNAAVIVEKDKKEPKGGRIFGPIPRELSERGYNKIASLASEVV